MKQLLQRGLAMRSRLYEYREWFYLPFILGTGWARSFGLTSVDREFVIVFEVTIVLLAVKLLITDYTWREIGIIGAIGVLLLYNYGTNGDRTMIPTFLAIIGAKGIDLERVFRISFWPKAILTPLRMLLAAVGVMENNGDYVGKIYGTVYLNFYGFDKANALGMNITAILLLGFLAYRDKIKWYMYIIGLMVVTATFPILQCKTAIVVWVVFCGLGICRWISSRLQIERIYLKLCAMIPLVLCGMSYGLAILYHYYPECERILDLLFTGRIQIMENGLYRRGQLKLLTGVVPAGYFDVGYFNIPYNYGCLLFVLWIAACTIAMWKCANRGKAYAVLVLAAICVYIFMEYAAVSTFWNIPLIYLAWALYPEDAVGLSDTEQRKVMRL